MTGTAVSGISYPGASYLLVSAGRLLMNVFSSFFTRRYSYVVCTWYVFVIYVTGLRSIGALFTLTASPMGNDPRDHLGRRIIAVLHLLSDRPGRHGDR